MEMEMGLTEQIASSRSDAYLGSLTSSGGSGISSCSRAAAHISLDSFDMRTLRRGLQVLASLRISSGERLDAIYEGFS